jgi:hypothetical protein
VLAACISFSEECSLGSFQLGLAFTPRQALLSALATRGAQLTCICAWVFRADAIEAKSHVPSEPQGSQGEVASPGSGDCLSPPNVVQQVPAKKSAVSMATVINKVLKYWEPVDYSRDIQHVRVRRTVSAVSTPLSSANRPENRGGRDESRGFCGSSTATSLAGASTLWRSWASSRRAGA